MERLTKIFEDGPTKVLTICQARCGDAIVWKEWSISKDAAIKESLMRLAAYEDTGLTPADIPALTARAEAAEAERDAAIADWRGFCAKCSKRSKQYLSDGQMDAVCATCRANGKCNWEWRGKAGKGKSKGGPK